MALQFKVDMFTQPYQNVLLYCKPASWNTIQVSKISKTSSMTGSGAKTIELRYHI